MISVANKQIILIKNKLKIKFETDKNKKTRSKNFGRLAEREGFEPPVESPLRRISSAIHSTTLPSFRLRCKSRYFYDTEKYF